MLKVDWTIDRDEGDIRRYISYELDLARQKGRLPAAHKEVLSVLRTTAEDQMMRDARWSTVKAIRSRLQKMLEFADHYNVIFGPLIVPASSRGASPPPLPIPARSSRRKMSRKRSRSPSPKRGRSALKPKKKIQKKKKSTATKKKGAGKKRGRPAKKRTPSAKMTADVRQLKKVMRQFQRELDKHKKLCDSLVAMPLSKKFLDSHILYLQNGIGHIGGLCGC